MAYLVSSAASVFRPCGAGFVPAVTCSGEVRCGWARLLGFSVDFGRATWGRRDIGERLSGLDAGVFLGQLLLRRPRDGDGGGGGGAGGDPRGAEEIVMKSVARRCSLSLSFFLLFLLHFLPTFCLRRRRVGDGGGQKLRLGGEEVMTVVAGELVEKLLEIVSWCSASLCFFSSFLLSSLFFLVLSPPRQPLLSSSVGVFITVKGCSRLREYCC